MRWLSALVAALSFAVVGPANAELYGVFVGINDYQYLRIRDLQFAEDDARLMQAAFGERAGLTAENARLLLGSEATRANVAFAVRGWLAERATPQDTVVFYFAGHGTQLLDDNGDEEDGKDEALLAWDSGLLDLTYIRDDDLNRWLSTVRAETIIVILDACHSGTGTRPLDGGRIRAADLDWRSIQISPLEAQIAEERKLETRMRSEGVRLPVLMQANDFTEPPSEEIALELAGCLPDQVVIESASLKHGALTYFVAEGLAGAADTDRDGRITLQEIHRHAAQRIKQRGMNQDPQLYGREDRRAVTLINSAR